LSEECPLIGIIGVGHFGKALIHGLSTSHNYNLKCSNLTPLEFEGALQDVEVITNNTQLSEEVDVLILTVRPQDMRVVLKDISGFDGLLITFAAGLPISYYSERLPHANIVRGMSNLGVEYQKGFSAWVTKKGISLENLNFINSFFTTLGPHIQYSTLEEYNLDIITALSGSGIGYVAKILEVMKSWGESQGLNEKDAEEVIVGTVKGLIEVYNHSELSLKEIVEQVASKGGTTEAGLQAMEERGLAPTIEEGLMKTISKCFQISSL